MIGRRAHLVAPERVTGLATWNLLQNG